MARKSRLSRLGHASWKSLTVSLTASDWQEFERALGIELAPEQREAITGAVDQYLREEGKERTAPFMADESAWLKKFRAIALDLNRIAVNVPATNRAGRSGLAEVQVKLNQILGAAIDRPCSIEIMAQFLVPAIDAVTRMARAPGFEEGREWQNLVVTLDRNFEAWGLPRGLRKDSDKHAAPSPFASFFWEVQRRFPEAARRHDQSIDALAAAMGGAIREIKSAESRS